MQGAPRFEIGATCWAEFLDRKPPAIRGNAPIVEQSGPGGVFAQVLRDASNLKPQVTAPRIVPVVNVVSEGAHLVGERIPVDLGQIRPLGIDVRRLERLPASLGPVVRQIAGHRMRVELRIELATGVVVIDGEHQVPREAILVGALDPHARRRRGLQFLQATSTA